MNKIILTGLVSGAISMIAIPFTTKKNRTDEQSEPSDAKQLFGNDNSPLFI